jgi:hypothetical protein
MPETLDRALGVRQLARRWKVAPKKIRTFIRRGVLQAFDVGLGRPELRIPPEAIREAEQGRLAVKQPPRRRRRQDVDPVIAALLEGRT